MIHSVQLQNNFDVSSCASQATSKDSQSLSQISTNMDTTNKIMTSNNNNKKKNHEYTSISNSFSQFCDSTTSSLTSSSSSTASSSSSSACDSSMKIIPSLHSFPKSYSASTKNSNNTLKESNHHGTTPSVSLTTINSPPVAAIDFSLEMIPDGVIDIDSIDSQTNSITLDPRYARTIYFFRKQMESKYVFKRTEDIFFKPRNKNCVQEDITERMRCVLVDWMIDVSSVEFNLLPATVFLAVQLLDRLIGSSSIRRSKFQLLGCACLLLASKFEEVLPLSLDALVSAADFCFDTEELVLMEKWCFESLHYDINSPTRYYFLTRFALAAKLSGREEQVAHYLLELSLQDFAFCKFPPSAVAAAALHLTIQMLRSKKDMIWTPTIAYYTQWKEEELFMLIMRLREIHWYMDSSDFKASMRKFDRSNTYFASQCAAVKFRELRFDDSQIDISIYESYETGFGPALKESKLMTGSEFLFC